MMESLHWLFQNSTDQIEFEIIAELFKDYTKNYHLSLSLQWWSESPISFKCVVNLETH
jgi:hypothetical protein